MKKSTELSNATNGGKAVIDASDPYSAHAEITGVADLLFHRWNCDSVEEKAKAAKGSKAKKTDDIESYLYRNEKNEICIPGEYFRMAMIGAAKFKQDPRSPRKSACDLVKAGLFVSTELASLGTGSFDFEDRRRVQIQRNGITRTRPAMKSGWKCEIEIAVNLPEYINHELLHDLLSSAGRLIGVGDFRPTFGRFIVTAFE